MIMGVDPDMPRCTNPSKKWVRHLLVGNLETSHLNNGTFEGGYMATSYRGPNANEGVGIHRYQFGLYEQEADMEDMVDVPEDSTARGWWNATNFLSANGLSSNHLKATFQFRSENPVDTQ